MDTIIEAGMLALVNQARAEHGLEATTLDALTDKDRETYRNRAEAVLYAIAPVIWHEGAAWALADQGHTVDVWLDKAIESHNPFKETP